MTHDEERELVKLRARVDDALRRDVSRGELEPLLKRLLELAGDDSDDGLFCHRHLAELHLEENPWQAALHLRRVVRVAPGDDMAHALMGLAQALLGNFDAAVMSYTRALALAPYNPWYHHNVGHLLDVALDLPRRALSHLRKAHEAQPLEDEVTASLAHCLARCGQLAEAEQYASEALDLAPDHEEHRGLLAWIQEGAPGEGLLRVGPALASKAARADHRIGGGRSSREDAADEAVLHALERNMPSDGGADVMLHHAQLLWRDFRGTRPGIRVMKPEIFAAALEYAVCHMHGLKGKSSTQASIARRYHVRPAAVSARYVQIRNAVELQPNDPRYVGRAPQT